MTSTVNVVSITAIASNTFNVLWDTVGVLLILLLIVLLVQKELTRVLSKERSWRAFDPAIVALLLAFLFNMTIRVINLITSTLP